MKKTIRISEIIISKYYPEFADKKRTHHILTSGRAGAKSSEASIKAVDKIVSESSCSVIIIRKFHNKIKKTVYKEVLRAIKRLGLEKSMFKITTQPMEIKYKKNGNTIYFTGSDSIDDTKGIIDENKPIKLVIIDEVTEFFDKGEGEDELRNIEATFVRGNSADFTMLYLFNPPRNPKAPVNQWREKMANREDCLAIHADYRDVPEEWLGSKLVKAAEYEKKADEKMYRWLWLGESVGIDEVIYYMFDESKHMIDTADKFKNIAFIGIGIDYGQMNATTFQAFGISFIDKKIYGIDEYYHSGRESMHQRSPSQYAADFKEFKNRIEKETKKKVTFVYIDPSAKGLAEEIKRVNPDVQIINADNNVKLGIQRVSKLLSHDVLILNQRQIHLKDEMYQYMYNKDLLDKGREEPIKDHDHCEDATRYLCMGFWQYIRQMLPNISDKTTEKDTEGGRNERE